MAKGVDRTITVDFSKEEESSGGRPRYPEQDYVGRIKSMKYGTSKDKGTPGITVEFIFTFPEKFKGKKISDTMWLTPKSLARVRSFLEAQGIKVPKKKVNIPVEKCLGNEVGFSLEDDEYTFEKNGKTQSRVSSRLGWEFMEAQAVKDSDFEPEDDDDDDDGSSVDLDSMDDDELREHAKKLKIKGTKKMKRKQLLSAINDAEDDDDDDDVEDVDLDDI